MRSLVNRMPDFYVLYHIVQIATPCIIININIYYKLVLTRLDALLLERSYYIYTSRLPVRCDGLQQYPRKLSIKKIQDFLLIVSALCIIYFFDLAN
jgi:hypothetical protein